MKKRVSILLAALMLLMMAAPSFVALGDTDYIYCYTFSDIQVEKNSDLQRYGTNSNPITTVKDDWGGQDLPYNDTSRGVRNANLIYLAKNEREGFQVYFYEKGEGRTLRLEVGEFTNANGDILAHEVFREEYFTPSGLRFESGVDLQLADALVPCDDIMEVQTTQNQNETFYIEVRSTPDQPAGVYYADVKLYDGETVLTPTKKTTRMAAVVWDFALPEQHYGSMVVGLYNSSSGYGDSCYFLKQNGIEMTGSGNVANPEDQERADAIIEGWNEYLLDHGISPYELPRNLIDTDPKKAEQAMADVRQKVFFVPLLSTSVSNGSFNSATLARINQYKDLIGNNAYLTNKAYLYIMDEPKLGTNGEVNQSTVDRMNERVAAAKSVWPGINRVITYCQTDSALPYDTAVELLQPSDNTICIGTGLAASGKSFYNTYVNDFGNKWRYHGDIQNGSVELWYWGKSTNGSLRRIFFWQQSAMQEDMFLYWQAAYFGNGNIWETKTLPAAGGIQTGNGNGILLYPGTAIGQPAETPIGSLRIKQIASGIDDADYLALAKEFMGQEGYETALRRFLPNALTEDKAEQIFLWRSISTGVWDMAPVNRARIALGNELEAAMSGEGNGEHEFGDWQIAVTPDETHYGVAIRTCANCGTEESKKIGLCDEGHHVFGDWTAVDAQTHTHTCEVCGIPETAAHTQQTVAGAPATCTENGATDAVVCPDCGYEFEAATVIAAAGHSWDEGTVTKEPTCTAKGEKTFHCANCTETKTEEIAALGHTAANADGKCERCGATLVNACKLCGEVHQGFPGVLVGFFHKIIYFFQNLFKR